MVIEFSFDNIKYKWFRFTRMNSYYELYNVIAKIRVHIVLLCCWVVMQLPLVTLPGWQLFMLIYNLYRFEIMMSTNAGMRTKFKDFLIIFSFVYFSYLRNPLNMPALFYLIIAIYELNLEMLKNWQSREYMIET